MANLLTQYREAFPEFRELKDNELIDTLWKKYGSEESGTSKEDFALEIKGRGPRIGAVKAGLESLKASTETGIGRLLYAAGAEETGKEMQRSAEARQEDIAERYQPAVREFTDITGPVTAGQYMYEGLAQSIPGMGAMGAGAAAGALAGSFVPGVGTGLGALIGGGLALLPSYIGGNIQEQIQEGKKFEETNLPAAAGAAGLQSAADVVAGRALLRMFPGLGAPGGPSRLLNAAKRGLEGVAAEAPTEGIQDALQIMQANPEKFFEFGPEVQNRIINAALQGGGAGFLIGGAGGALSRTRPKGAPTPAAEEGAETAKPSGTKLGVEPPPGEAEAAAEEGATAGAEEGVTPPPAQEQAAPVDPGEALAPAPRTPPTDLGPVEAPATAEGEPVAAPEQGAAPAGVEPIAAPETAPAPTAGVEAAPMPAPVAETPATAPAAVEPVAAPAVEPPAAEPAKPEAPAIKPFTLFDDPNPPTLPKPLQLGDVYHGYQKGNFKLNFATDVDRALFQATKKNQLQKDMLYRDWLKGQGLTDGEINTYGKQLRDQINGIAGPRVKSGELSGLIEAPRFTPVTTKPATAAPAPTPAPAAAPAQEIGAVPFTESVSERSEAKENDKRVLITKAPGQDQAKIKATPLSITRLNNALPGGVEILRELSARLFPGVNINLDVRDIANNQGGSVSSVWGYPKTGGGQFDMVINIGASRKFLYKKSSELNQKTDILHTMLHELSHPLEHFHLQNSSKETIDAVVKQYLDEVNPIAAQRAAVYSILSEKFSETDPDFMNKLAVTLNLQPAQIKEYVASTGKKLPPGFPKGNERSREMRDDYNRSFTEWIAEKGAEWLRKEMEGLVPKTAFQKFQKEVLDRMRALYAGIQQMLGIKPTPGAFEKFMEDTYGKVKRTPSAKARVSRPDIIEYRDSGYEQGKKEVLASQTSGEVPDAVRAAEAKLADAYVPPKNEGGFKGFINAIKEAYRSGSYKDLGDKISNAMTDKYIYVKRKQEEYVNWLNRQGLKVEAAYDNRHALAANLSPYAAILGRENVLGMLETLIKFGGEPTIKNFSKSNNPLEQALDGMLLVDNTNNKVGLTFLADLMRAEKIDGFKYYSMAKRVLGRYADKQAPITQAEAKSIVDHYGKDPVITKAYQDYQNFNKALMKMAVDSGVISQDVATEFMKYNDYYPFYREMDETGKYTGPLFTSGVLTRTKIQQALGGTEQLQADPVEVIMKNAQFWMHSAAKNIAARKIFTMMESMDQASKVKPGAKIPPDQSEGVVRVNGVEQRYALKDPLMAAALETTGAEQLPNWAKGFGKFTQFYRELVTRSPDFILKNVIRDPLNAFVTSGVSFNPFVPIKRFVKGVTDPQSMSEMQALQNWGIKGGFRTIAGLDDATQLLNDSFTPTANGIYVVPNGNVLTSLISKAWNKMGDISEASDSATRMEIYKRVLEKTGNEAEAAFRAQEVINFRKQGASSLVRYMSIMVPFVNGRLQGMDVTARAFHKDNLPYTIMKGGYLFGVAMGLQALLADDEEYKQLPEYVRYASLPIPLKMLGLGDSGFLAIPKPFEIGFVFQTVPEIIVQTMMGNAENRDLPKAALEQLKSTFGVNPFPQFASPILEIYFNRSNLTGLPIVTEAMKNLPAELQYTSATSDVVKNMAGAMGLSPVQVEALIKGYGGQVVTSLLGLIDGMYRSATGTGVDKDWTQYPTISTFLKTAQNTNPRGVADIYRLSAEIQGVTTAINTYVAQGRADLAQELMKKNEGLLTMKQAVTGLRTQLNTLSRNERMIVNNPNIPQDQKEVQVEQIREARRQIGKVMTENLIDKTGK